MTLIFKDRVDRNTEKTQNIIPKILNFSSYDPNDSEISLLSKGLKFCPTPFKPDLLQLEVDIVETIRKFQLKCQFNNFNSNIQDTEPLVQKKSNYIPPDTKEPLLNSVLKNMKHFSKNLYSLPKNKVYDNISKAERNAINSLKNNSDIIITSVDKGSSIIILNRSDYVNSINSMLKDSSKYKKEKKNPNNKYFKSLNDFTLQFASCFDEKGKELDFVLNFDSKLANFYGLPKLHKCTSVINLFKHSNDIYFKTDFPPDLTFRCITAGIDSPFSKLSILLDKILKPICIKVQSFIRDSTDFLNKKPKGKQTNPTDLEFITCDIKNMYNNLPVDLVIEAMSFWLENSTDLINQRFTSDFILTGLNLVLSHSSFQFNGQPYSLLKAIATGEPVAATIATLTVGYLELKLYEKIHSNLGSEIANYFISNWKRFLDDCFIVWRKSLGNFDIIFHLLNNLHPSLTFTKEQSDFGVPFLNLFIYKEEGYIKSDIYYKPTDSHDYLPFNSCHPRHIKINIPGNLARMICTIVEDPLIKVQRLQELKGWLLKCGYPLNLIKQSFSKFIEEDILSLREKFHNENDKEILACVLTFNPKNPNVFSELNTFFNFLKSSPLYKYNFGKVEFIKSQRQPPNLGRMLEKHDISLETKPKGSFRCNAKICDTCNFIEETNSVQFSEETFVINRHFDCTSKNIIYKLTCNSCNNYYIGKTTNLKDRVSKHKSDARLAQQRMLENRYVMKVSKHLNSCSAVTIFDFKIVPFFEVKNPTLLAMLTVEDHFIKKFKPTLNG